MTYQPVLPVGGYSGWKFLQRTESNQRAAFDNNTQVQRDLAYFKENISGVETPEQLVSDYRLLRVSLSAFGLEEDIGNKFFIKKVLEDGVLNTNALANKLTDTRYKSLSKAFGFGDFDTPNTQLSTFADDIAAKFKDRSFEAAVGNVNEDMRLALNAKRELSDIASKSNSDATKWFTILGNPPLRTVFEGALNLPNSFATLPIDTQMAEFKDRADRFFGSSEASQFKSEEKIEDLIQRFMLNRSLQNGVQAFTPASAALTILQAITR